MNQNDAQNGQDQIEEEEMEAENEELSMEALLAQSDFSLNMPKQGQVRQGVIASVSEDEILVSIGTKSEGVIPGRELSQLSDEAGGSQSNVPRFCCTGCPVTRHESYLT